MNDTDNSDLADIASEVMDLVGFGESPLRSLFGVGQEGGLQILDEKFQYLMDNVKDQKMINLAMYLRGSYSSSRLLKNWLPLLKVAKRECKLRGADKDMFYGLDKVWGS